MRDATHEEYPAMTTQVTGHTKDTQVRDGHMTNTTNTQVRDGHMKSTNNTQVRYGHMKNKNTTQVRKHTKNTWL